MDAKTSTREKCQWLYPAETIRKREPSVRSLSIGRETLVDKFLSLSLSHVLLCSSVLMIHHRNHHLSVRSFVESKTGHTYCHLLHSTERERERREGETRFIRFIISLDECEIGFLSLSLLSIDIQGTFVVSMLIRPRVRIDRLWQSLLWSFSARSSSSSQPSETSGSPSHGKFALHAEKDQSFTFVSPPQCEIEIEIKEVKKKKNQSVRKIGESRSSTLIFRNGVGRPSQ